MACELAANCDLIFGILTCNLPEDTIDVDLKVHTLQVIHMYEKDRSTQVIKCSLWGTEVNPFPPLQKEDDGIPLLQTDHHHPLCQ